MKYIALVFVALLAACGGNPPPQPPQPPQVPQDVVMWRGQDQVELTWSDMPVTVLGGSEDRVLRRRLVLELPTPRKVIKAESFMGFDRGDIIEATAALYDEDGVAMYRRSLHKESGQPDCYDAYASAPYSGPATSTVFLDIDCRVNGANDQTGSLSARCHLAVTLTFEQEG